MNKVYVIEAIYSYREEGDSWIECVVLDKNKANIIAADLNKNEAYEYTEFFVTEAEMRN